MAYGYYGDCIKYCIYHALGRVPGTQQKLSKCSRSSQRELIKEMKCTEENGVMIVSSPYMVVPNTERRFWFPDADNSGGR